MINDQAAKAAGPAELPETWRPGPPCGSRHVHITVFRPAFAADQANQNLLTDPGFLLGKRPDEGGLPDLFPAQEPEARARCSTRSSIAPWSA